MCLVGGGFVLFADWIDSWWMHFGDYFDLALSWGFVCVCDCTCLVCWISVMTMSLLW